jgi:DNA-binding IclR family transcriptional regulator
VLGAFTVAPHLSLAELTARTGLPKPTVHRLASSLLGTGFLRLTDDGRYALGAVVGELSAMFRKKVDLSEACTSALDELAERTGETVMLAAADWTAMEMTVIGTRVSHHTLSVIPPLGGHVPISAGALGQALLMGLETQDADWILSRVELPALTEHSCVDHRELSRILIKHRAAGFATALEEYADGVTGVAVPILVEDGRPRGAIGISGPAFRMNNRLEELGRTLFRVTSGLRTRPGHAPE